MGWLYDSIDSPSSTKHTVIHHKADKDPPDLMQKIRMGACGLNAMHCEGRLRCSVKICNFCVRCSAILRSAEHRFTLLCALVQGSTV